MTTDLLSPVLAVLAVPLAGLLADLILKLRKKWGVEATAQDRANMETEITAALNVGIAAVGRIAPLAIQNGINDPETREAILREAATYFRQRFPDRSAQIGGAADRGTRFEDVHAAVQQTLDARLTKVIQETTPAPVEVTSANGGKD